MIALRRLALHHHRLFAALLLVAFAVRMLTPSGYMFAATDGMPSVLVCSGKQPTASMPVTAPMQAAALVLAAAMPGKDVDGDDRSGEQAEMPCAFAVTTWAAVPATDPMLPAAIAFVMLLYIRGIARLRRPDLSHIRPPLRGPPARA